MKWLKPRRLEDGYDVHGHLTWSMVHPAADGSVLLEAGAPMTDGRTCYIIWVRIPDDDVDTSGGSPYSKQNGSSVGRYADRWYASKYEEGGLADAKWVCETIIAKEAAP